MAAAICSTVALIKNLRHNPVAMSSTTSISSPLQTNFGSRRSNHLRPKILRTLIKPYPTTTTLLSPVPLERPGSPVSTGEDISRRDVEEAAVEDDGNVRVEVHDAAAAILRSEVGTATLVDDNFSRKLDAKVVAMYALGLFVLQTVSAVLIFGSAGVSRDGESESRAGEKERLVFDNDDGRLRRIMSKAISVVNVDESVLEERITDIRAMARQAREREAKAAHLKSNVDGFREDEVVDEIGKEVNARLIRLQKKFASVPDKSLMSIVDNMSKVDKGSGSSNGFNESPLAFEKKRTFRRSVTTKQMSDGKAFSTVTNHKDTLPGTNILAHNPEVEIDFPNSTNLNAQLSGANSPLNVSSTFKEEVHKKMARKNSLELKRRRANKKTEVWTVEPNASNAQDFSHVKLVDTSKNRTLVEETQQEFVKNDGLSFNGTSKNKGFGSTALLGTVRNKGSDKAVLWWLNLPYFFGILMHQGSGDEGPGGLYTLKASAKVLQNQDEAFTVAFEDRVDANNFCYILESFFEDTIHFSADIVPLPTKEMQEAVESGVLKMIVVRKGQLELYAGQPLEEVESRIRLLIM